MDIEADVAFELNVWENFPHLNLTADQLFSINQLQIHMVHIPASISLNNIGVGISISSVVAKSLSLSLGFFSLNGSTLSLANSASRSLTNTGAQISFISLATSSTQYVTPGIWFFGAMSSTAGNSKMSFYVPQVPDVISNAKVYGGPFFRGMMSVTTNAMPVSIATSDLSKEGASTTLTSYNHPYILIAA